MRAALILGSITFALGATFAGCGDECSRAGDCAVGEVCAQGVCTRSSADYLACTADSDCGGGAAVTCIGGRCSFTGTGTSTIVDAGVVPDMGMTDAGSSTVADAGN